MPYPGRSWSYPGKDDIADYLEAYASRFRLPVRTGVKVIRLTADGDSYRIETNDGLIVARNVVVATGPFHHPRIPGFAGELEPGIVQMHSSEYRSPTQVQDGPVLVVGAGQSGAEIALDMSRDHKVWLSGRDTGEEPVVRGTLKGNLVTMVFAFAARNVINVANPLGRKLRAHFFYPPHGIPRIGGTKKLLHRADVEWVERTGGVSDGFPQLENGRVLKVNNVIWCTGFVTDYRWIELSIFDEYGFPAHKRGVVDEQPGLYFIGMPFQSTLSSSLVMGVGKDAGFIARHIALNRTSVKEVEFKTSLQQSTLMEQISRQA